MSFRINRINACSTWPSICGKGQPLIREVRVAQRRNMRTIVFTALLALFASASLGYGQTIDANLVGTVVDVSGAAVPNATISMTHVSTGIISNTKTNADGQY